MSVMREPLDDDDLSGTGLLVAVTAIIALILWLGWLGRYSDDQFDRPIDTLPTLTVPR